MKNLKFLYFFVSCTLMVAASITYADNKAIKPTSSLLNGTANYQEVLAWSEKTIKTEKNFPVKIDTQCGKIKLLFIQETPTCGTINCHYLIFKNNQPTTYFYLGEIDFSAVRLFCYPKGKNYTYYLFSSLQESNASGSLQLGKIQDNHYQMKTIRQIDYTNKKLTQTIDLIWEKQPQEQQLLIFFKE